MRRLQVRLDVLVAHAVLRQQAAQLLVLVCDSARGDLDLGGGFDALEFALAEARFELLEVFFAAGAGAALVVADAREVGFLLWEVVRTIE